MDSLTCSGPFGFVSILGESNLMVGTDWPQSYYSVARVRLRAATCGSNAARIVQESL